MTFSTLALLASLAATVKAVSTAHPESPEQIRNHGIDKHLAQGYAWTLLGLVALALVHNWMRRLYVYARHLSCITASTPGVLRHFSQASPVLCWVKGNLIYAPIMYYRRARELRFSRYVTFGTLPTRFQAMSISLIVAVNIFMCTWNMPWSDKNTTLLPVIQDRTGTLSVVNMLPLMVMATAKNPLIGLLDISYDTFNLMHRWFGRICVLEAVVHTLAWVVNKVQTQGWKGVKSSVQHPFIYNGLIAMIMFSIILLHSPKMFRSLAYEFFLHTHIVLVVVVLVFIWFHLVSYPAYQNILLGAIALWGAARLWRLATLLYRSVGRGGSKARIEALAGGAVKVTLTSPRPWTYRPGQSLYLTIPAIGLWTAHPFSVAWSGVEGVSDLDRSDSVRSQYSEKNPINRPARTLATERPGLTTMSLIVKAHRGVTQKLHSHSSRAESGKTLTAFIEGPYGTERSLSSYGTVMLFASGVGITHQLGHIRELVEGYGQGTVAAKRVTLVWVIPTTDALDWVRPWMHEILGIEGRRDVLRVLLYVTQAGLSQSINSPSETVRMSRGRPDVQSLVRKEAEYKLGCIGVSVCAGGGLADEVRRVSRVMLDDGVNLDFIEEGFGW